MNVDQLLREKPHGIWRVYLKKPHGYMDVSWMWEFYDGGNAVDIYILGGNVPNPFTHRLPTATTYETQNESWITISNIERVERL